MQIEKLSLVSAECREIFELEILTSVHIPSYIGYKHEKDAKTVQSELELVFPRGNGPCKDHIYGWFEE